VKPVTDSIEVPQSREQVYDFLEVLGDHEQFTDHFLTDWETSGPASGVGAKARMQVKSAGLTDTLDMEVVAAERPRMIAEESVSAKGRRRTRGTYRLEEDPDGGTVIEFELEWLEATLLDQLTAPIARSMVRNANIRALQRLRVRLEELDPGP
jgi:ribosome-associated toxin RatA of RatAB toxin-antitoxin module